MTDSRAFGYIFGSPDSGHRFFGIKTDKAASQVVLAMRDLFQVVFELKKKEIELARQHIQSKITAHEQQAMAMKTSTLDTYNKGLSDTASGGKSASKSEKSPESVADLVDLEQELSSIQRGISQMERITPNEVPTKSVLDDDPFGDSFTNVPPAYNILPPPPESSRRHQKNRSTEHLPATEVVERTSPLIVPPVTKVESRRAPDRSAEQAGVLLNQNQSCLPGSDDDWLNDSTGFECEDSRFADEFNEPITVG
jgi:disabled family protein 2